jgi:hypothetical protein
VRATGDRNFPGYGLQMRNDGGGQLRIERPGLASLGTAPKIFIENAWCWLKLEASGSTIRGRVWLDGASEPTTWDITVTDSTYPNAGYVGFSGETNGGKFDDVSLTHTPDRNSWGGIAYNFIVNNPTLWEDGDIAEFYPAATATGSSATPRAFCRVRHRACSKTTSISTRCSRPSVRRLSRPSANPV